MRKKELIKFNAEMFERLDSANANISALEAALKKREIEIDELNNEIIRLRALLADIENQKKDDNIVAESIDESEQGPVINMPQGKIENELAFVSDETQPDKDIEPECEELSFDENEKPCEVCEPIETHERLSNEDYFSVVSFDEKNDKTKPSSNEELTEKSHIGFGKGMLEFSSDIIGKIVVSAARQCNKLSVDGNKELINLILGRTEVAKAEILDVAACEADDEHKRLMITGIYEQVLEYISSVAAQV